jgi:RNA polymerase sigma factor (sigma-70 family)
MKKGTQRATPEPVTGQDDLTPKDTDYYKDIINKHIKFIEIQCGKAVKQNYSSLSFANNEISIENEALELNNIVLDKLKENNYKVLRQFKGNAMISTYITAVISHKAVDLIRKKKGRGREKERAKKIGDLGEKIYDLIFLQKLKTSTAYAELKDESGYNGTLEELEAIVAKIKGKGRLERITPADQGNRVIMEGVRNINTGEVIIADTRKNPEELIIEAQKEEKLKEVLAKILSQLKGEERLILRMRFPVFEDEKPQDIGRISGLLGVSKKAVYNRIGRVLNKCRDMMINSGVDFDDLF